MSVSSHFFPMLGLLLFAVCFLVAVSKADAPPNNVPQISQQNWQDGTAKIVADDPYYVNSSNTLITTNWGLKVNDSYSLKAGERGPTLMEDFLFREKMTHFDHERIPERVVHARGVGVHGYFQSYGNFSKYTRAAFLQDSSVKTPVFVRFSTVAGFRGSADTARDVRGFATRFYTQEGNFDLVGNNIPIFFIQDAIKFPDLIHAVKPEPQTEVPQAATAHDTAWDFFSLHKETTAMIMWAMSGRAIPRSLRTMEGFGIHTFLFVNSAGQANFIKWHWKPRDGLSLLVWDEAQKIGGKDPDFHRRDLYDSITNGNFPQWELGVQIIPLSKELSYGFDILDPTKFVPEDVVPIMPLGLMTLNRIPDNYFAETEQVTFHLGHIVPGIDFSNDPLLQGRLFSYVDTQLARHRTANYLQIPINRPLVPVYNNYRDSFMQTNIYQGQSSYYPNSVGGNSPDLASPAEGGFESYPLPVSGNKIRSRSTSFVDYYSQAQLFWNSQTDIEKQQIVDAMRFELGKVASIDIRTRMVENLLNVDFHLARRVAAYINVPLPQSPVVANLNQTAPNLSIVRYNKTTNRNKKVAVLAAAGVNATQLTTFMSAMAAQGVACDIVGPSLSEEVAPGVMPTQTLATTASVLYDAVFLPGGSLQFIDLLVAPNSAYPPFAAQQFVQDAYAHAKPIGAVAHGTKLLRLANIPIPTQDRLGNNMGVLTLTHKQADVSGSMSSFDDAFSAALLQQRFWSRMAVDPTNF